MVYVSNFHTTIANNHTTTCYNHSKHCLLCKQCRYNQSCTFSKGRPISEYETTALASNWVPERLSFEKSISLTDAGQIHFNSAPTHEGLTYTARGERYTKIPFQRVTLTHWNTLSTIQRVFALGCGGLRSGNDAFVFIFTGSRA